MILKEKAKKLFLVNNKPVCAGINRRLSAKRRSVTAPGSYQIIKNHLS